MAAAGALTAAAARWALPDLVDLLGRDNFLINRQFTQLWLERMLGVDLRARGYQFYMMADERRPVLERLKAELLPGPTAATGAGNK